MSGALSSFARTRRRRFERGGSADTYSDPNDSFTPPPDTPPPDVKPIETVAPPLTPDSGALSSAAPPPDVDTTLANHQTTAANLSTRIMDGAGIHTPSYLDVNLDPSQRPGASNLPMLAAAGAMLQPTHSGTFSEALGRAFSAAAPVAEQERATYENALLRKAQQENTAAYQQGMLGVRNRQATTAENRAATYAAISAARAQHMANGDDEKTANDKAIMQWRNGQLDAYIERTLMSGQLGADRNDIARDRNDISRQNVDLRRQQLAQSAEFANLRNQMQTAFHNDTRQRLAEQSVLNYAASQGVSIEKARIAVGQQFPELLSAEPIVTPAGRVGGGTGGGGGTSAGMTDAEKEQSLASARAALGRLATLPKEQADKERANIIGKLKAANIPTDGL